MAENTINDYNTLPEQVQINKDDITKLKDDINKIKPNAWEERKFILNLGEDGNADFTTYNPIIDTNAPVNFQKSFTGKDTYSIMDAINSYSFFTLGSLNGGSMSIYAICTDPSNSLYDLLDLDEQNESGDSIVLFSSPDETGKNDASLFITCTKLTAINITSKSLTIKDSDANVKEINKITDNDDYSPNVLLTAAAIDQYYLKKTDASNNYATKTELRNANQRIDALNIGSFDVDLTIAGLAKIKADVTIGTPITLTKDTDFSESLDYTDYKTVLFTLYTDKNEVAFISTDIKLDVGDTVDVYGDNDQNYTWLTGIGVIKLGPNTNGNNYLCYISYSQGYTSPLVITPIQKLS